MVNTTKRARQKGIEKSHPHSARLCDRISLQNMMDFRLIRNLKKEAIAQPQLRMGQQKKKPNDFCFVILGTSSTKESHLKVFVCNGEQIY